jgi:hypothetical protein
MSFHKMLVKFTKIRIDFQLINFFGEFYMIISLSVFLKSLDILITNPSIAKGLTTTIFNVLSKRHLFWPRNH